MYIHHYIHSNTVASWTRPTMVIIEVLATVTTTSNGWFKFKLYHFILVKIVLTSDLFKNVTKSNDKPKHKNLTVEFQLSMRHPWNHMLRCTNKFDYNSGYPFNVIEKMPTNDFFVDITRQDVLFKVYCELLKR